MCGILGGNWRSWNYKKALDSLKHRGPDGQRIINISNILIMGFTRLSIIDLSENGMQPMTDRSSTVTITFNGEIYDYISLRKELILKGYSFKSESDTEVVLNAYCEWGDSFIDHIDGMFAIAIYDSKINQLKLYRDRAGIKPLYWYYDGNRFAYASELKGIVNLIDDTHLETDATALYDYFNYLYIPDPKTIYKNIHKLESAHRLVFDFNCNKILSNSKYWNLNVNPYEGNKDSTMEQCENVRKKIIDSVRTQMVADVPVGGFLSGGIDSSILSIEAYKINPLFKMFSIGFYDFETNELPYVECLENVIGFKSQKYLVKKSEFDSLYFELKKWFDEPFCDTSAYPTYILSSLSHKKCLVALSGDGGDELFGGYSRYAQYNMLVKNHDLDKKKEFEFLWDVHTYYPKLDRKDLKKQLKITADYDDYWFYRKYYIDDLPPITRMQYMDFYTYLPCDVLTKTDRVGMAVSLETRVPFLSKDIIEYAFSLNQMERCPNGELKGILKRAYTGIIPDNLLHRRKWGFGIPNNFFGYDKNPQMKLEEEVFHYGVYKR